MPNLDGVQKLSREELEARRKIVLGMIGENVDGSKVQNQRIDGLGATPPNAAVFDLRKKPEEAPEAKAEDGKPLLKLGNLTNLSLPFQKKKEDELKKVEKGSSGIQDINFLTAAKPPVEKKSLPKFAAWLDRSKASAVSSKKRLQIDKKIDEDRKKKFEEEGVRRIEEEKAREVEQKIKLEKERIELLQKEAALKAMAEQKASRERAEVEKKDKEAKIAAKAQERVRMEQEEARLAKERISALRRIRHDRKKAFLIRFRELKSSLKSLKKSLRVSINHLIAYFFVFLAIYFSFVFCVLFFGWQNPVARFFGNIMIVPAIIVEGRVVDYYQYLDTKKDYPGEKEAVKAIMTGIIEEKLLARYKVSSLAELEKISVYDYEINKVPMSRIGKIKKMINNGEDFIEVAKKYGEELKKSDISVAEFNSLDYGDKLRSLDLGEKTDIITMNDGYYIFMCAEKFNDKISVSYVFIKAKTAQEYVAQAVEKADYLSFVE